jgi:hypothetical protein
MRVLGAFVAGVGIAAILLALEFLAEGFAAGLQFSAGVFLGFTALNLVVGFSATLVGGVPIWLILRSRHVRSPWAHASVGAVLGLVTYLLLVAMGMGQPSDHPMTFFENLGRSFHIPRIAAVMIAGAVGAIVFWFIAIRRVPPKIESENGVTAA